ncbi:putative sulfate transporter 3-4 [Nymphaea thermarum]|nr:putative sulfate transporter 3-4 [Nymphaea thermarum]
MPETNSTSSLSMEVGIGIHKVSLPPPKSTLHRLKAKIKETFFPDDPLRQFKGQSCGRKWILALQYVFPILQWGPNYSLKLLKSDIISGLTIASLAIPQGISYAKLANLPPIIGLFAPPLVYAVFGSSRDLAVGPVSIASLVLGSMLREEVSPTKDPLLFLQLAFTTTFFAGVFQASLGLLRLGFIIDFLSKATLIGFMAGAAVIVSLQQLKSLLGITNFAKEMAIVPVMSSVFHRRDESLRRPKLFWVSAAAPLASVVISTVMVFAFKAEKHGISIIGHLQAGLNPPSWNLLHLHDRYLSLVVKTGIMTGIVSLTEGIAVGRTFASLKNYKVDGNKEMMAIGLMNMVGACTSCYVTTGSFSRSAVNHNAGCKTGLSNIVMAVTVMVTLLFLMPLFLYTPNVVLGAIIVTAVIGLMDYQAAYLIWKVDKLDFVVCLIAFFGVIFISVQAGLAIAIAISIFKILLHVTRPRTVALGRIPGSDIYQNKDNYKAAVNVPGFLILRVESPIYFSSSSYLQERIMRWVEDEEENCKQKHERLQFIVLDMSAVTTMDTSGISMLTELRKSIDKRGLQFVLANPVGEVTEKLQRADLLQSFGVDGLFLTVGEAVVSLSSTWKGQP